jgi:Rod binding domain-containing protein
MSILPTDPSGLAPIDQSKLPTDVRKAGPQAENLYKTALAFEQVLLGQLTEQLQATAGTSGDDEGDDSSSSDPSASMFTQMVPGAFAQGLTGAGGIGIARQLYDSLKTQAGIAAPETKTP